MDKIIIRGLEVYANHGCMAEEKSIGQKFLLNAEIYTDMHGRDRSDEIGATVDYAGICDDLIQWMKENTWNLIETAADTLAMKLLRKYIRIQRVVIEVEKPSAPIRYHFDSVIAHVERARHIVYLGLGSNLGSREENIADAIEMLDGHSDISIKLCSALYETKPYGYKEQPDFINACAKAETFLEPHRLLEVIHVIEEAQGRKRELHWGPRTIDIDILLYDSRIIDTEDLHIPHIDMQNRMFVLAPLAEIAGFVRHPLTGLTIDEMRQKLAERENLGQEQSGEVEQD